MDDIINITETTILLKKEYYDEHMKKHEKLVRNNRRMKNLIKNLKETITNCQNANKTYKSEINDLIKEKEEIIIEKNNKSILAWDKCCENQILHNELNMVIEQGYELSEAYKEYSKNFEDYDFLEE